MGYESIVDGQHYGRVSSANAFNELHTFMAPLSREFPHLEEFLANGEIVGKIKLRGFIAEAKSIRGLPTASPNIKFILNNLIKAASVAEESIILTM
jgi:hypothetical protein